MKDYFTTTSTLRCLLFTIPIFFALLMYAKESGTYLLAMIAFLISIIGDMFGYIYESNKKAKKEPTL